MLDFLYTPTVVYVQTYFYQRLVSYPYAAFHNILYTRLTQHCSTYTHPCKFKGMRYIYITNMDFGGIMCYQQVYQQRSLLTKFTFEVPPVDFLDFTEDLTMNIPMIFWPRQHSARCLNL